MAEFEFYVDLENAAGVKQGSGPVTSAADWRYTASMDGVGSFSFSMSATDAQAAQVVRKRIVRAFARLNDTWVEVGAGIVDNIVRTPQADGSVLLQVSGADLLQELTYRSVLDLKLTTDNDAITHAQALSAIAAYAPPGWTFVAASGAPSSVYGRFQGETVFAALRAVAEKTETHFYRGAGRTVIFANTFSDSGVRAIAAGPGDLAAETCAIVDLTETIDTYDLITRIYPRGAGNGDVQLTLKATTRTAPAGYTLDKTANYIESTAATAAYGLIESFVEWRDVAPVENTIADVRAASNQLFDEALRELTRRSVEIERPYYALQLAGCSKLLRPLQTTRVVYRDTAAGLNVDAQLNILEATWAIDANGITTASVVVTSADLWPQSDTDTLVDNVSQGRIYQALPQMNANEYVTAYTKHVDNVSAATFFFRFSRAVTALRWAFFEFQLLPFESTVKSVGGLTSGSGSIPTTGPSTNASGNPSNNASGTPSDNTSGTASGSTGEATGNTGGAGGNTGASVGATSSAVGSTGVASGNTGAASGDTGSASGNTGSGGDGETSGPQGEADGAGRHDHNLTVGLGITGSPVYLDTGGTNPTLRAANGGVVIKTGAYGDHTHDGDNHTHSLNSHTHSLNSHTHDLGGHSHSLNNHTHTVDSHSHTLNNHSHSLNNHTHSLNNHTHSLNNHTHSLSNHVHDLADSITAVYGIFRESSLYTYGLQHLEYRVNSGDWAALAPAVLSLGSGWYRLDITPFIQDEDTLLPLAAANTVQIRSVLPVLIQFWAAPDFVGVVDVYTVTAHGLSVGDSVEIAGSEPGFTYGVDIDGTHTVSGVVDSDTFQITIPGFQPDDGDPGGTVSPRQTSVTIDAQLSVHTTIQPIYQ